MARGRSWRAGTRDDGPHRSGYRVCGWTGCVSERRSAAKDDSSVFGATGRMEPPLLRQDNFGNGGG